jgi:hypothetical protein
LPYAADGRDFRAYFDMIMDLSASLTLKIYVSTGAGYASCRATRCRTSRSAAC